jgi:hypothetical protein
MLEPSKTIIEICGGVEAVANLTGRSTISVRRWGYPKSKGGTGGHVPADVQAPLLNSARAAGIDLRAEHFFIHQDGAA